MGLLTSRPALRWAVPAGIAALVLTAGATGSVLAANADEGLPPRSAAELLVDVQNATVDGMSGTVVWQSDLGLPAIPGTGKGSSRLSSLVSGSHTLRVWYSGPDKARVALLGTLGESDTIRNGNDVWVWSSETNTATHYRVSPSETKRDQASPDPSTLPKTPQEAADRALKTLDPSTKVTTNGTARVAGRSAYELVLTPRDSASLVGEVRVAIDGKERVPLRVQVFSKGSAEPAFEVAFTRVSFDRPGDEHFTFTPPRGAKVVEGKQGEDKADDPKQHPGDKPHDGAPSNNTTVVGDGWTSVLVMRDVKALGTPGGAAKSRDRQGPRAGEGDALQNMLGSLPRVSGPWGSGRLLSSKLFSVLITDDGRMLVGAVSPERLYQAAADPKAAATAPQPKPKATK